MPARRALAALTNLAQTLISEAHDSGKTNYVKSEIVRALDHAER
jgi:hypothetical protein